MDLDMSSDNIYALLW